MARKKPTKVAAPAATKTKETKKVEVKQAVAGASIGIDFGSKSVGIAAFKSSGFEAIANDNGERDTPLYVSFTELERIIGGPAKDRSVRNPSNTVHSIRNFLSQSSTEIAEYLMKGAPFTVVDDANGKAAFQITINGTTELVSPDTLITLFSQRMKKYADDFWDCDVTAAAISVPVGFSAAAKSALVAAVEAAGFKVVAILADPVAAALSFNLDLPVAQAEKNFGTVATPASALISTDKTVLVADIGAHTSTLTLLRIQDGLITVGASSSTTAVSGQALDDVLYAHFAKSFESSTGAVLEDSPRAVLRLKHGCEQIKRTLAMANQASIQLDALCEGNDLFTEITRTRFELLSMSVFNAFSKQITDFFTLPNACAAEEVTHVCLVGGTANLTKFQTLLQNAIKKVSGHSPAVYKQTIAGDAVAFGAAKQASIIACADLEAANANKVAVNKAIKSGDVPAPASDAAHCFNDAYNAPQLALQKGIFVQSFSGAFLPLLPPLSSMPSTHTVCLNIPQNIPATHAVALAFYESGVAAAAQVAKDPSAKRIGVFKVPSQAQAVVAADTGLPVTATIRAVMTTEAKLTVDVACSTKNTTALTFVNLFTVDLAAKPITSAANVPSCPLSHAEKKDTEFRVVLTKLQALVAQWKNWRAYPKHVSFLQKHAHVMPAVNAADATVESLKALVDLPNPYQPITADKATLETMNQAIKNASASMNVDQLTEACEKLADDILRVRKTKGLTAAEARALDRVYAQKAVAVKQVEIEAPEESDNEAEFDIDAGLDFGDFSAGEESDEPESDVDFDFGGDLD